MESKKGFCSAISLACLSIGAFVRESGGSAAGPSLKQRVVMTCTMDFQSVANPGIGYRVSGIGYRVSGIGYRVSGVGCRGRTGCLEPNDLFGVDYRDRPLYEANGEEPFEDKNLR
ncbi:MAG: hypothetical protein ACO1RT_04970 [Planctomycetaceae bacterium]